MLNQQFKRPTSCIFSIFILSIINFETMSSRQPSTISERRSQYPLHERLIVYNSESMQRMIDNKTSSPIPLTNPTTSTFMVNGVNILNKNSLDSDTVMHRIIQRRKTHNRVERRRRDRMVTCFIL